MIDAQQLLGQILGQGGQNPVLLPGPPTHPYDIHSIASHLAQHLAQQRQPIGKSRVLPPDMRARAPQPGRLPFPNPGNPGPGRFPPGAEQAPQFIPPMLQHLGVGQPIDPGFGGQQHQLPNQPPQRGFGNPSFIPPMLQHLGIGQPIDPGFGGQGGVNQDMLSQLLAHMQQQGGAFGGGQLPSPRYY